MNTSRRGYVLLETVIATGLLIVGLAVIGAEIQDSDTAIRQMRLRLRAMTLAEQHLAEMDLGLIELDSVDEVQDGDFGPRYPDFGWRLTTEPTAIEGLFRLTLDVMHHIRESPYKKDDFEVETAEKIFTAYAFRAAPQSLDLGADFGLKEDQLEQVSQKLSDAGVPVGVLCGCFSRVAALLAPLTLVGRNIPVAVILGPDELANGTVAVKDLRMGKEKRKDIKSNEEFRKAGRVAQRTVPRAELIATVQEVLAQYPE